MLEAEISVDGDVYIEGHHVGQLAGFRFVLDQSAEGPDAKAVLAAAQKALALEYEARAARLHAAGNGDFAFGSDGTIRWLGEPVAKLAADESVMRPRVILLADELLSGSARDFAAARVERFVNHHIATVLKPLDDLSRAEDLEGLAKGLAFRLVENLGVLFRRDVADEVKTLDQSARGSLRRYGVRFGAYHIFMPALLKPAPAELITLLWALKNDALDKPGYGDLISMLAAGRTSIVADPAFERDFYKLAGFRYLGKRAVRIDILERLSDLIRPALQWNQGAGQRPDGAYDGRRFTTTPAMLSILGATQDDIEEILKGLGYRADSVAPEAAAAHIAALDAAHAEKAEPVETAPKADDAAAETAMPDGQEETVAEAAAAETADLVIADGPAPSEEIAPATAEAAEPHVETAPNAEAAEPNTGADAAAGQPDAAPDAQEEPRPVLLWRPAGRNEHARGQQHGRGGRPGHADGRRGGAPGAKGGFKGKGGKRDERAKNAESGDRKEHPGKHQARPPRKEKPIDPDSPFAKLAVLKEQLKK